MTKVGFELFLPAITAAVRTKEKQDENYTQLTEPEYKAVVRVTFRDAMIAFMKDSQLYQVEVPISLYQDVKRYDILPPEGFITLAVIELLEHKVKIPAGESHDLTNLWLTCCPQYDMPTAFFVKIAVIPKRSHIGCSFDEDFLEAHYEPILSNMFMRLSRMQSRQWESLSTSDRYQKDYTNQLREAKRVALSASGAITLKTERFSDGATR